MSKFFAPKSAVIAFFFGYDQQGRPEVTFHTLSDEKAKTVDREMVKAGYRRATYVVEKGRSRKAVSIKPEARRSDARGLKR